MRPDVVPQVTLLTGADLLAMRDRPGDRTIALGTGCFDILHPGHVAFTREAAEQADVLVLGINSDRAVRSLKGQSRPVMGEHDRAAMVGSIRYVDAVFLYDDVVADDSIRALRPDVFIMGEESFATYPTEVAAARSVGARIHVMSRVPGFSTTSMLTWAALPQDPGQRR